MASVTDETSEKIAQQLPNAAGKSARMGAKAAKKTAKGIVLSIKGGALTLKAIMEAIRRVLDFKEAKSGIAFAIHNVSIDKLQKQGNIVTVDSEVTKEIMKPLNKLCKKNNIKYTALYDKATDQYKVFFSGKSTEAVEFFFKKASLQYLEAQQKKLERAAKMESVRGKITFFRDRAKEYNRKREKVKDAKSNVKDEIQK